MLDINQWDVCSVYELCGVYYATFADCEECLIYSTEKGWL